ncbi:MAG TPA: fibronectin type III domain-containing protein [Solirubrobacteraceae bacterium]|jgi:hypothetical protein|nr:fibronectin type III domain-containing protein [Solirubrobacteraceae bacterium]
MRGFNPVRRIALCVLMLAITAVSLPLASPAATSKKVASALPGATTNGATHVLGTSALLTAAIHPNGKETTYYFKYGTTTVYGSQTPTLNAGSGTGKLKVGQPISGLLPGTVYHYRVVATNSAGRSEGRDRTFATIGSKLKFVIPKPVPDVFGSPMIFTGTLAGFAGANHHIALQASPYPYLESFTNIGLPGITDRFGRFAFRVANLMTNTEFRVVTLDALPLYSPVVTVPVAVRVTFSARSSASAGLVRLYGTVMPAVAGARVQFQLLKAVRPGKNEESTRYVTQFSTAVKHGGRTFSRFSLVVKIRRGGRYRVFVKVHSSALVSGSSTRTIVLHAPKK